MMIERVMRPITVSPLRVERDLRVVERLVGVSRIILWTQLSVVTIRHLRGKLGMCREHISFSISVKFNEL